MAKKNIPYDQKYYDPEIECMPRPELEKLQLERLQAMVRTRCTTSAPLMRPV